MLEPEVESELVLEAEAPSETAAPLELETPPEPEVSSTPAPEAEPELPVEPLAERFPERRVGTLAFSGGLADELSALTGATRPTARPQATVRAIPETGGTSLTRDRRVDRETLMKIIDGIKGL